MNHDPQSSAPPELQSIEVPTDLADLAFAVMSVISDEVTVTMSQEGWYMRSISPAMEAMAVVKLAIPSPDLCFSVDIADMRKALSLTGPTSTILVGDGSLRIQGNGFTRRLPVSPPEVKGKEPNLDLQTMFAIPASTLLSFFKSLDPKKQDAMSISVTPDAVSFIAHDDTDMGLTLTLTESQLPLLTTDSSPSSPTEGNYVVSRWQDIAKVLPRDAVPTISMDTDFPAILTLDLPPLSIRWMIAPRIMSEDDL